MSTALQLSSGLGATADTTATPGVAGCTLLVGRIKELHVFSMFVWSCCARAVMMKGIATMDWCDHMTASFL